MPGRPILLRALVFSAVAIAALPLAATVWFAVEYERHCSGPREGWTMPSPDCFDTADVVVVMFWLSVLLSAPIVLVLAVR